MRVARDRLVSAAATLTIVAVLALPGAAIAHATLEGSSPPRGVVVKQQPDAVSLRFNESVEGNFGAVRVYDSSGSRADRGDAFHPDGEGSRLAVHLRPDLPDGSYTATYRVVSADGHIVSGGYVFSIGRAGRAPSESVAELVGGSGSGSASQIGLGVARGIQYAAMAIAVGGLAFLLLAWAPARRRVGSLSERWESSDDALDQRMRVVLLAASAAGALSAVAAILFEAAQAAGVSVGGAFDWTILREELGTRFGTVWGIAAIAWAIFGLTALLPLCRFTSSRAPLIFVPLALIVLEPALSGHPGTQSPVILLFPANAIHVIAMSVWVGGLASLILVLPRATRELDPSDRTRLLAATLARFSPIALICVALILLTGLGQTYAYVRDLDNLVETAYGRAVLIKFVLLVGLLVPLGAFNRHRSVPRLERLADGGEAPGRGGVILRRAIRLEIAILVVVIGVTAALSGYAPATTSGSGPFSASTPIGPAELEMTVDPARVGANRIHLYLFDAVDGSQFTRARELDVTATLPERSIGPLTLDPRHSGPGHYTAQGAVLNVAGTWDLDVTVRTSAFDEYSEQVEVPIR